MNWIQTYTGKAFHLDDPSPDDVDKRDIAHALSMICRYGGHTSKFYSVGEHCVLMSYMVQPENALAALLHDATEAYVSDMVRPLKRMLPEYEKIEQRVWEAICTVYGLSTDLPAEVKEADSRILADERYALLGPPPIPWMEDAGALGVIIEGWPPEMAERRYLDRFNNLIGYQSTPLYERLP